PGGYAVYDPQTQTWKPYEMPHAGKQPTLTEKAFLVEGTPEDNAGYKALREFTQNRYVTRYDADRTLKEALLKAKQRQWDQHYTQKEQELELRWQIAKLRGTDATTLETLRQAHRQALEKLREEGQRELEKLRQGGRETLEEQRQGGRETLQD